MFPRTCLNKYTNTYGTNTPNIPPFPHFTAFPHLGLLPTFGVAHISSPLQKIYVTPDYYTYFLTGVMPALAASYTGLTTHYKPPTRPTISLIIPPISNKHASTTFFNTLTTLPKQLRCSTYSSQTINNILYFTSDHSS
jgi:hypothetical protein